MNISPSEIIFAFDMSRVVSVGGVRYLWDFSGNGFHFAFPGGAADPTPRTDGGLNFDGGDWLDLPASQMARFYAAMPAGAYTFLCIGVHTDPAATACPFSCDNNGGGGVWRGILTQAIADGRLSLRAGQGGAALPTVDITALWVPGRRRSCVGTSETTPRGMIDQQTAPAAWTAGAFGALSYDAAIVPAIGVRPGHVSNFWTGPIYYEALIRGSVSSADLSELSALLAVGRYPFCWRQT